MLCSVAVGVVTAPVASGAAAATDRPAPSAALRLAAAPAVNPAAAPAAIVRASGVFVVGDSLTVGSGPYLRSALAGRVRSLSINARVGRHTSEGVRFLRTPMAVRDRVWVVELGTNDSASAGMTRHNVRTVMHLAGPSRRVVWVNVSRPGGYDRVNNELAQADARYQNLLVVDWASFARVHPSLVRGDRVHLTPGGYRSRGQLIAGAIREAAVL